MLRLKELRRRLISARTAEGSNASETRNPSQSIRTRVIARYGVDWYSRTNAASPPGYTATRFAKTAFVGGTVRPRSTRPAWAWFTNAAASPGFGTAGGAALGSGFFGSGSGFGAFGSGGAAFSFFSFSSSAAFSALPRSEERRVGKDCRFGCVGCAEKGD